MRSPSVYSSKQAGQDVLEAQGPHWVQLDCQEEFTPGVLEPQVWQWAHLKQIVHKLLYKYY
jgi:hypothetical protein